LRLSLSLSLSLNNTLCLEIPLSKCKLLQRTRAYTTTSRAQHRISFFFLLLKMQRKSTEGAGRKEKGGVARGVSNVLCCEKKRKIRRAIVDYY
jgi:hypothetical protein